MLPVRIFSVLFLVNRWFIILKTGLRLSKKFFSEKKFLNSIKKVFDNYDHYLKNAEVLSKKLPEPNGAENAARRIAEIVTNKPTIK